MAGYWPAQYQGWGAAQVPGPPTTQAAHGQLVHRFLAQLVHWQGWRTGWRAFQAAAGLEAQVAAQLTRQLAALFATPQVQHWFSNVWESKREATLLAPTGEVLRPDRVLLQPGRAVVIDFKTGGQQPAHAQQVRAYAALLQAMGCGQVEAYLLYIAPVRVVPCPLPVAG